jgi:hypothetical protein
LILGITTSDLDRQFFSLPWIGFSAKAKGAKAYPHLTGDFDDEDFLVQAANELEHSFKLITVSQPLDTSKAWTSSHLQS